MEDRECVLFLQWALPRMRMRWAGFRRVRRQVCRRVGRRISALGLDGLESYERRLERDPEEWRVLDGLCRITISRFYRDRSLFDVLAERVLPAAAALASERGEEAVRCWSAGCASGEEPYTLALIASASRIPVEILGTDADESMLDRAREGLYRASSLKDLPGRWREGAFTPAGRLHRLRDEYRGGVRFRFGDIRSEAPAGTFHLVLCRNLAFTYFEESLQREVLERLEDRIVPGGFLVIGSHERIPEGAGNLEPWEGVASLFRSRSWGLLSGCDS
jgi:chemotaxis protein methyltransferase CheR